MRGFEYLVYSAFSISLLLVLVLLPLNPIFASETDTDPVVPRDESEESTVENNPPAEFENEHNDEEQSDTDLGNVTSEEEQVDPISTDSLMEISAETAVSTDDVPDVSSVAEGITDSQSSTTVSFETTDELNSEDDTIEIDVTEGEDVLEPVIQEEISDATTTPEILDEETNIEEITSTSSEEVPLEDATSTLEVTVEEPDTTVPVNTVINDDNHFSFAKSECTLVGEGSFYCSKPTEQQVIDHTDRVFSSVDTEGDKEIYVEKNGERTQITDNQLDDDAPYYDKLSDTIVWHRLIEGRYQIISYEVETSKEEQITTDRFNNMEPQRSGNATVWQGWVGNDWEIFMLDGEELSMLTDNTTHDITPSINGDHLVWQSFESDAWIMKVYDLRTKSLATIEDAEGGSIENPRFVLVYDSKQETGDIETRGYDLESGEVVALSSEPAPVPQEIPDPEQTGEERALVTPQTQLKTKVDGEEGDEEDTTPDLDLLVEEGDIIVAPLSEVPTTTPDIEEDNSEIEIPSTEATSSVAHIDDLIITPYVEPIEPVVDSQDEVASST